MDQRRPRAGLFCILLLFVISIGMLHSRKTLSSSPRSKQAPLSTQDTIDLITPLLISKSFDAITQVLAQFDSKTILAVLERIISDEKITIEKQDQSVLLLNAMANFDNAGLQNQIYQFLKTHYAGEPIYVYSILDNTPRGVERTHKIAQRQDRLVAAGWAEKSMAQAIELDDVDLLDQLYALGVRVSPAVASTLLHEVVINSNNVAFVPALVRNMKADPNFSSDGSKTVLIEAVEKNNEALVRALLEEGADPATMLDEEVGTAQQIAYENGYVSIERLLKEARKK